MFILFFIVRTGESNLTKEALTQHDAVTSGLNGLKMEAENVDEDSISFGNQTFKTFDTFASDWSHCSNMSFNKLVTYFMFWLI